MLPKFDPKKTPPCDPIKNFSSPKESDAIIAFDGGITR